MKILPILTVALAAIAVPVAAADDPIAVRKALMSSNGSAAGVFGGVSKGEITYAPAVGKAAISAMASAAMAFGDYFPEGTAEDERTTASPKIWEDMAGFQEKLDDFKAKSMAAVEASGKDGPADAEAFKAAMGPTLDTCKGCHETYRIEK